MKFRTDIQLIVVMLNNHKDEVNVIHPHGYAF